VRHAVRQRQLLAAAHQLDPGRTTQAEQPLAQRIARALGFLIGPQQRHQALARRGASQRKHGEHGRVEPCQRQRRRIAAAQGCGAAGQRQPERQRCVVVFAEICRHLGPRARVSDSDI